MFDINFREIECERCGKVDNARLKKTKHTMVGYFCEECERRSLETRAGISIGWLYKNNKSKEEHKIVDILWGRDLDNKFCLHVIHSPLRFNSHGHKYVETLENFRRKYVRTE